MPHFAVSKPKEILSLSTGDQPATPEPVLIDEGMVNNMLSEYKSHFPKEISKKEAAQ